MFISNPLAPQGIYSAVDMGSCISSASSEIHAVDYGHENLVYYQDSNYTDEFQKKGSIFSHQGSKGLNQDAAILHQGYGMEDGAFCGIFDGHGSNGHRVSTMVRNRLPSLVINQINNMAKVMTSPRYNEKGDKESLTENKRLGKWKEAFVSVSKVMDKEIKFLENVDCSCSGTTAVVVVKQGESLVIANLGDSRAILGTKTEDGIVPVQLTTDLKPGLHTEAERIRKCNGRVMALQDEPHIQRVWLPYQDSPGLAMSRAFGDFMLKSHGVIAIPEVSSHQLSPQDQFLLLATDGVWDVLSNEEVVSVVSSAANEKEAARAVVEASIAAWKKKFPNSKRDDITVLCLFLD